MKRLKLYIFSFLLFSFFCAPVWAQNSEHQVLIPHTVYVGDTAQLNISFSTNIDFFEGSNPKENSKNLSLQNFTLPLDDSKYTVKNITLIKNGKTSGTQISYTISFIFSPWITGKIKLPAYKLENDFMIIPSEISIDSIFTAPKISRKFVENKGPLLIPGTTYRIIFKLISFIIFAILIITALINWQTISLFCKNQKLRFLYKRNMKHTFSSLNQIETSNASAKTKAEEIQKTMRNYLTIRFGYKFTNCGTTEIYSGFQNIFQGLLSEKKEDAVDNLTGIFTRTDFIRYSKNGTFENNELGNMIQFLKEIISTFEKEETE